MVVIFLHIVAHDIKNRVARRHYILQGQTMSRHFNVVINAIFRLHEILLKKPKWPTQYFTMDMCLYEMTNKMFFTHWQNCLGALDGIHIKVNVSVSGRPRYRSRKGNMLATTNILGVCSQNGEFIFVMYGWKGFVSDSRVIRDAVSRPTGLKVPKGRMMHYFLPTQWC